MRPSNQRQPSRKDTHTVTDHRLDDSDRTTGTPNTELAEWVSPSSFSTAEDFVAGLRLMRIVAGKPSFQTIAKRAGRPRSTVADAVRPGRTTLPNLEVVMAFVAACSPDVPLEPWHDAWVRLSMGR